MKLTEDHIEEEELAYGCSSDKFEYVENADERERESEGPALFRVIYRAYVTAMVPKL